MGQARVLLGVLLVCSALGFGGSGPAGRAAADFPLFDPGERVDGLPLTTVLRRDGTARYVSFVYGDCAPRDGEGCAAPAEVQVWPACRRNLELYEASAPGTPTPERVRLRGVPGALLEDGLRLELQTARSTVVVFGDSHARVMRIAAALRRSGEPASAAPLPPPASGAVEGRLGC